MDMLSTRKLGLFIICTSIFLSSASYCQETSDKAILDEAVRYIKIPQEGEAFGIVRDKTVRLKLDMSETYDDNIYLTKDNARYDLITSISPGIDAYYSTPDSLYFASYQAEMLIYSWHPDETRLNQDLETRIELFRNSRFKFRISDSFRPTTDPATSELTEYIKRIANNFVYNMRYDMSDKSSWEINYNQIIQNYLPHSYQNFSYIENEISPIWYWHISPKTSVTCEYDFGIINYYEGSDDYDSYYHQARVGISGKLTPKSTIFLKAGYQYRIYESPDRKNTQLPVLEGIYQYNLSEKTNIELIAAREINESVYEDAGYYKSINLYAKLSHNLTNSLLLNLSGVYIRSDYPRDTPAENDEYRKRSDNLYGFDGRFEYRFRYWLMAYLGYEYKIRESNIRDFRYKDSKIFCGGKIDF